MPIRLERVDKNCFFRVRLSRLDVNHLADHAAISSAAKDGPRICRCALRPLFATQGDTVELQRLSCPHPEYRYGPDEVVPQAFIQPEMFSGSRSRCRAVIQITKSALDASAIESTWRWPASRSRRQGSRYVGQAGRYSGVAKPCFFTDLPQRVQIRFWRTSASDRSAGESTRSTKAETVASSAGASIVCRGVTGVGRSRLERTG